MFLSGSGILFAQEVENYPVINSNEVLSSEYLSSAYHRVESVDFENGFYIFNVESDFGHFDITSLALLKKRVQEIRILGQAINQFERQNEELSQELRSELRVTGDSAVDIITSPFNTASKLAGQLSDNLEGTLAGEDPYISYTRSRFSYAEPKDPTTAAHKRNIAYQMRLDLYSSNYRVQSFLNSVANARSAGRVSAGVGLGDSFASVSRSSALDMQIGLQIKNKSLDELNEYNLQLLNNLRVRAGSANAFMQQSYLSPGNRTVILVYLNEMKQVNKLGSMIELVSQTDSQVMAMVYERMSKGLYYYFKEGEQFTSFFNYKGLPAVITGSRKLVVFEHQDLMLWSDNNRSKYIEIAEHAKKTGYTGWELVALGNVSTMAERELDGLGFIIRPVFLSNYTN